MFNEPPIAKFNSTFIGTNLLLIDIDEGMKINDAIHHPLVEKYASFIYTSPSHQKEKHIKEKDKNGNEIDVIKPACDRFRIVFFTDFTMTIENYIPLQHVFVTELKADTNTNRENQLYYTSKDAQIFDIGGSHITFESAAELMESDVVGSIASNDASAEKTFIRIYELPKKGIDTIKLYLDHLPLTYEQGFDYQTLYKVVYSIFNFLGVSDKTETFIIDEFGLRFPSGNNLHPKTVRNVKNFVKYVRAVKTNYKDVTRPITIGTLHYFVKKLSNWEPPKKNIATDSKLIGKIDIKVEDFETQNIDENIAQLTMTYYGRFFLLSNSVLYCYDVDAQQWFSGSEAESCVRRYILDIFKYYNHVIIETKSQRNFILGDTKEFEPVFKTIRDTLLRPTDSICFNSTPILQFKNHITIKFLLEKPYVQIYERKFDDYTTIVENWDFDKDAPINEYWKKYLETSFVRPIDPEKMMMTDDDIKMSNFEADYELIRGMKQWFALSFW
jgi:hypothetical protein